MKSRKRFLRLPARTQAIVLVAAGLACMVAAWWGLGSPGLTDLRGRDVGASDAAWVVIGPVGMFVVMLGLAVAGLGGWEWEKP